MCPLNEWSDTVFPWELLHRMELELAFAYDGPPRFGCNGTVTHPFYTWWLILEGCVEVETQIGGFQTVSSGEWILIPVGQKRRQCFQEGAQIISVNFIARWQEGMPLVLFPSPIVGKIEDISSLEWDARECCRLMEGEIAPGYRPAQERHFSIPHAFQMTASLLKFAMNLFSHVCENGGKISSPLSTDRRLEIALASMRNSLKAGPLPYSQWESEIGIGRAQLDRLAMAHLRTSLVQYRNQLLVRRAYRCLASLAPIKQIALDLGFVDGSHFCRFMRAHTGRTPAEIRTGTGTDRTQI